ncbi:MAG: TraR/DksA family transcriptional regulator [Bryobacteraceae bacterium]|jgi:DnaK suppressor protein|nr:TraR/DksA family transcriptional regulator [Bryobacteraceae bacterium]
MTKTELNRYKEILENRQAELAQVLRNREGIAIEKTPDALDEVQLAGERELAIRNLDRESNLLRNVRAALRRIEEGTYGICVHCEEEISAKRLNAVPWTPFCISCQEQADKHQEEGNESFEELLVNAA